jgi:hypothetical protein
MIDNNTIIYAIISIVMVIIYFYLINKYATKNKFTIETYKGVLSKYNKRTNLYILFFIILFVNILIFVLT